MVKNPHTEAYSDDKVVVLDFDLAWFQGAVYDEVKVSDQYIKAVAYYAPEFRADHREHSSKVTAIDVYGFGMCLFYTFTGRHPYVTEPGGDSWEHDLNRIRRISTSKWQSIGSRLAHLIQICVAPKSMRAPVDRVEYELSELVGMANGEEPNEAMLWLEELAVRAFGVGEYHVDDANWTFTAKSIPGVEVIVRGQVISDMHRVSLQLRSLSRGDEEHKTTAKYMENRFQLICEKLSSSGWKILKDKSSSERASLRILSSLSLDDLKSDIKNVARSISDAKDKLTLN